MKDRNNSYYNPNIHFYLNCQVEFHVCRNSNLDAFKITDVDTDV